MITGIDPRLVVSPADDDFHRPTSADPRWLETVWFPFWIPEEGISVYARIWFRPNTGEQGGAVHAWRGTAQMLAYDGWTERFVDFGDLRDLALASGFRLVCLEPLARYRIVHASRDLDVDVVFTARMEPNPVPPEESPGMFAGHVEQPGHVVGRVRIGARRFAVDCGSVRDRSWGPREARSDLRLGNAHGTSRTGDAFFVYVNPDARGVERITSGYLLRDGRAARIVEGLRFTEWDGSHPRALRIDARDALGRPLRAEGRCVNRQAVDAGHDVYAVLNQVDWQLEGSTDRDVLGENHDVWSRSAWLAAGRAPLPKR